RARRAVSRPDPGGHARTEPRGREVRLAPRLQVLDLRHLVDPPVGAARRREPRAHDPRPRARRRAAAEAVARSAPPRGRARARGADPRAALWLRGRAVDARGDRSRARSDPREGEAAGGPGARAPRGPPGHDLHRCLIDAKAITN